MATDIKTLKKRRATLKGSITRIEKFVQDFSIEEDDLDLLKVKYDMLNQAWNSYDKIQEEIELQNEDEDEVDDDRGMMEDRMHILISKFNKLFKEDVSSPFQSINSLILKDNVTNDISSTLPKIELKKFNGDYESWLSYSQLFKSLIVDNKGLNDIEKLHYLRTSVSGPAELLIKDLPFNPENFDVSWNLLTNRYENRRIISAKHASEIINIPAMQRESDVELSRFIDKLKCNLNALRALQSDIPYSEIVLLQLLTKNLHTSTIKAWESSLKKDEFPSVDTMIEFLERRRQVLENTTITSPQKNLNPNSSFKNMNRPKAFSVTTDPKTQSCKFCSQPHTIYKCPKFLKENVLTRFEFAKKFALCFNCLKESHSSSDCKSTTKCRFCNKPHNSLLHRETKNDQQRHVQLDQAISYCGLKAQKAHKVLLATAVVKVKDPNNQIFLARALLDIGSQVSFISESLAQRLNLKRQPEALEVTGISNNLSRVKHSVNINIGSRIKDFSTDIRCFVLPRITTEIPSTTIQIDDWNIPENIVLADNDFFLPGEIQILLGAEIFFDLLTNGKIVLGPDLPVLQNSQLGWIISGKINKPCKMKTAISFLVHELNLQDQLQKFWQLEELHTTPRSKEDDMCERHFKETTKHDKDGRFIVHLPRREDCTNLGDSYTNAKSRFHALERKFDKNPQLKVEYVKFMNEYKELGHMKLITKPEEIYNHCNLTYYLPHHAIFKENSTSTKVRVVFDASAKTSTNVSLNEVLMIGPQLQQNIVSIIIRFRTHVYAMTADVKMMYRMIHIHPSDYDLQRILWRNNNEEDLEHYQLCTVTYGTAPAAFLATRCLQQVGDEHSNKFPEAAEVIKQDFYMDDLQTGKDNVEDAIQLQQDVIKILDSINFTLHKWCSNDPRILQGIPKNKIETSPTIRFDNSQTINTLGLIWDYSNDVFKFDVKLKPLKEDLTKREILSVIASIYDPLGIIGPVLASCKIFMQQLWCINLGWNQELDDDLKQQWISIYENLKHIRDVTVPRLVKCKGEIKTIELHGFADASERAYGACLFLKCTDSDGVTTCHLLCAKSRVAPIKQVSLPRLELCGCLILARLVQNVVPILRLKIDDVYLWTDSTVVLSWLSAMPTRWKTFVANRVSEIQELTSSYSWKYVPSEDNPCDVLSRGTSPKELQHHRLWWHGPEWLSNTECNQPEQPSIKVCNEECRVQTISLVGIETQEEILTMFSSFVKMTRVLSYCLRFIQNARFPKDRTTSPLTVKELDNVKIICIRQTQHVHFKEEIAALKCKKELDKKSSISSLHPFLDGNDCLRVGGRLKHANIPYDTKHQLILPKKAHITRLLIENEHVRLLHAGPQLLHSSLRQNYWIMNGKTVIRAVIHKCLKCFRLKAETAKQLMGQLPRDRVNVTRPFFNCGVDYAGPLLIKQSQRSKTKTKCYVAIFICFCTKAIHMELVSDLTSNAFIAALRRFFARRGLSSNVYCDNGTNFVGANNYLKDLYKLLKDKVFQDNVASYAANQEVQFHFIPAHSPHFGGLWESGVRTMKYHLRRVMGNMILTFEELQTILTQIEGCLNSRPICAIPSDPSDPQVLTIGHFLIGSPITSIPDHDLKDFPSNRLSRWQSLQKSVQQLWELWYKDYLHQLQQRSRWCSSFPNVQPGMVVLLKDDNIPILHWRIGVIERVHQGQDGVVRVVSVRSNSSVVKRAIH